MSGGWGSPPGGTPPGGPGGGGFGAPPQGSPGGVGAPPGGFGVPGGGGPAGPPGPPGPPPGLPQIPFSSADLGNIKMMSTLMFASAGLMLAGQVFGIAANIIWAIAGIGSDQGSSGSGVGGGLLWLPVFGAMAAMLVLGALAFRKVIDTDDADQKHLEDGLGYLRNYFVIKGAYYLISIFLTCCVCIGATLFFGMLMGMIGAVGAAGS